VALQQPRRIPRPAPPSPWLLLFLTLSFSLIFVRRQYYSSDTQYVCLTPPAVDGLEGSYSVQIATDGIAMGTNGFATCLLTGGVCQFTYFDKYTSKLRGFPAAAGAGAVLPFQGSFVDASLFAQWQVKVGDNAGTGSTYCDLDCAGHPEWALSYGNNSAVVSRSGRYLAGVNVEPMWVSDSCCYVFERTAGQQYFGHHRPSTSTPSRC